MVKKLIFLTVIFLMAVFFYNLFRQIYESLQVVNRLDEETEDLTKLQQLNFKLKKQLAASQNIQTIEKIARDKLNMSRAGETVVIIPPEQIERILTSEQSRAKPEIPNWQGWLKLFWR